MYNSIDTIKASGFTGFKTIAQLWNDYSIIPNESGIYLILNPHCSCKQYLKKGVGGFFKGKDPNLSVEELDKNWVNGCHVLYIGKAGGIGSSATLRKRLKQYLDFGKGKPVGHYGGRLIWQLANHPELIVAWKSKTTADPRTEERNLLREFEGHYVVLPFANLRF
jgi:hypothetical protein